MKFEALRTFSHLPHITDEPTDQWRDSMRAQADKVHEEAAELMVAAKHYIDDTILGMPTVVTSRQTMSEELSDIVQALANLAECMGLTYRELEDAAKAVDQRNVARGRF